MLSVPSLPAFHVCFSLPMIIWSVATLEDSTWHLWRPANIQLMTSDGAKHDAWLVIKRSEGGGPIIKVNADTVPYLHHTMRRIIEIYLAVQGLRIDYSVTSEA